MRSLIAFMKKEMTEQIRSSRLLVLGILFVLFGIMNPAVAKLTPWLLEMMADSLAESGMTITQVTVTAMDSWVQFFKNMPMALIAFVLLESSIFTKEYQTGTLLLSLTKGLSRYKVIIAKSILLFSLWSAGYWVCFGVTYVCNEILWGNSTAANLMPAVWSWWLLGVFVIALVILFSVISSNYIGVLLGTGGSVFALYLIGLVPKIAKYLPTYLMNSAAGVGMQSTKSYTAAVIITAVCSAACVVLSVPIFNKKQI